MGHCCGSDGGLWDTAVGLTGATGLTESCGVRATVLTENCGIPATTPN